MFLLSISLHVMIQAKAQAKKLYIEKARSVVLAAESAREEMGKKWKMGLFTQELLRKWAEEGEVGKVIAAVPVVTAWQTSMAKASEGGYTFKVPKFSPRNPENQPDPLEAEVLKKFKNSDLTEYSVIDKDINSIRYFRPIRLSKECLYCHGDPVNSVAWWGNNKGLDPTGTLMENWKVGEIHGAFEVVQSLDEADAMLRTSMIIKSLGTLLIVILGSIGFYWTVTLSVIKPVEKVIGYLKSNSNQVSSSSSQVAESSSRMAEGAINKAANANLGVQVATEVQKILDGISGKVGDIRTMIDTVDTASNSQAHQIKEITESVTAVDQVTQSNAASAEESAASSEELFAQAASLQTLVGQLESIVHGSHDRDNYLESTSMDHGVAVAQEVQPFANMTGIKPQPMPHNSIDEVVFMEDEDR